MRQATVDKRAEWKKKHEEQATYDWRKKKTRLQGVGLISCGIRSRKVTQARLESVAACDTHALKFLSLYYP